MDSTDLNSILSDEAPAEVLAPVEAEQAPEVTDQAEPTGETTAPPAEPPKVEEKQSQGLVAAAIAERNRRQEAERQAAHYRDLYEQSQRAPKPAQGEPDPNQYTDTAQYINDLVEYRSNQRLDKERQTWQQQQQRDEFMRELQTRTASVVSEGQTKYPDFDASIEALRPVLHDDFKNALVLRGNADVAYHLSKDLAEAYRVASLNPNEMLLEIAELRGMLRAKPVAPPPPVQAPIPRTLTHARDARGQFQPANTSEMTPLDAVLNRST